MPRTMPDLNRGIAVLIGSDVAGVDVHHLRRFDSGVVEVSIGRVQRVVNLEVFLPADVETPAESQIRHGAGTVDVHRSTDIDVARAVHSSI
jgi:hypothetical protein